MSLNADREGLGQQPNPLAIEGIEFIEFATRKPQALGQYLERFGFRPVARHRSREVLRYCQGSMNIIINSHGLDDDDAEGPRLSAIALRVQNAAGAWRSLTARGAWPVQASVEPMELWIPGIHGVGDSRIYLVDRWREFSIYDVDFVPIPTVDPEVPAICGLRWFGIVQYVGTDRSAEWIAFYHSLFGFIELAASERFGILPRGSVLRSPCGNFFLQLIEAQPDDPSQGIERLQRIALATPDVPEAIQALRARGIEFVELGAAADPTRGALTRSHPDAPAVELVRVAP